MILLPVCNCLADSSTESFYKENVPGNWKRILSGGTKSYFSACPYELKISLSDKHFLMFFSGDAVYFSCTVGYDGCLSGRLLLTADGKYMMFYTEDGTGVVYQKK